ncbi:integrase core domain-containing protein, partial [Corynebacterium striatum]
SVGEVELATLRWVHWWNTKRLHEALDYATPQEVETEYYLTQPCQMRVLGTGVPETRYCRVPGSWYRGRADGVGPAVCFIRPVL